MAHRKQYANSSTLFKTKCIDPSNSVMLQPKWYNVIEETDTQYLIQFYSGGAKWYDKTRFQGKYFE